MTNDVNGPPVYAPAPKPESNPLGLAGFIVSLIGLLCAAGTLSPIGLILSFVALFRQPRGFAIAGFVLGLIGSAMGLIIFVVIGVAMFAAILAGLVEGRGHIAAAIDGWEIRESIVRYEREHGSLPASIDALSDLDPDDLNDRWGRPYRIEIDAEARELIIVSDGPDGIADTEDDITIDFTID